MTSTELANIGSLDDLDHRLRQIGMTAGWNRPAPRPDSRRDLSSASLELCAGEGGA